MSFVYVSGVGTDSTEKGRTMWARVKGKTENDLMKLPFKNVFAFRPGFMKAMNGQQHLPSFYKYLAWLYPVLKVVFPSGVNTLKQVGNAMIYASQNGYDKNIITVKDITLLAEKAGVKLD